MSEWLLKDNAKKQTHGAKSTKILLPLYDPDKIWSASVLRSSKTFLSEVVEAILSHATRFTGPCLNLGPFSTVSIDDWKGFLFNICFEPS